MGASGAYRFVCPNTRRQVLKPERELIPREEREAPECKHLDVCRGFTSDTFMTFRLPRIEVGVIGVCCFAEGCGSATATLFLNCFSRIFLSSITPQPPCDILYRGV